MQTIFIILKHARAMLAAISSTSRLDAEILLAYVLNVERSHLYAYPEKKLSQKEEEKFNFLLQRRLTGEPIAYILGKREFWSLELAITKDVFIPRSETETLVEIVLQKLTIDQKLYVADLGTGSGAIALAIAKERPHWQVIATDTSKLALQVACENARQLKVDNVEFYCGDCCAALPKYKFDAIISNPPYIKNAHPCLRQPPLRFEPRPALEAGEDGLDILRLIARQAKYKLRNYGWLFLEHGFDQGAPLLKILDENGYVEMQNHRDLAGIKRVAQAKIIRGRK